MRVVKRSDREMPGWRSCHFCDWKLYVTEFDLKGDTVDAYDRHLSRHAEAIDMSALELAIFNELVRPLDN